MGAGHGYVSCGAFGLCAGRRPILLPKPRPVVRPVSPTLLVICDLACNWKLDGVAKGSIVAGGSAKANVVIGEHLMVAATVDGLDKLQNEIEIKIVGQTIVHIELQPVRDARLKAKQDAHAKNEQENKSTLTDPADELWDRVKDSKIAEDFDDYCAQFAKSPHCAVARGIATHLRREAAAVTSTNVRSDTTKPSSRQGREQTIRPSEPSPGAAAARPLKIAVIVLQTAVAQTNEGQRSFADFMKDYARDLGYTQILDVNVKQSPVLYADSNTDITKRILDAYNLNSGNAASASTQKPATASAPVPPAKVAVITFQTAVAQTNEGQRNFSDLQKKYEPKRQQLKALLSEIDNLTKQQQEQSARWSDSEQRSFARTIEDKKKQLEREAKDAQDDFQQEMQDIYSNLASKFYDVMTVYVKAHSYTLVLDSFEAQGGQSSNFILFSADPNAGTKEALIAAGTDITQEAIQAYNIK
jgi:outer membrane protein